MALVFSSKQFLREVITDFQALLSFMDTRFGKRYTYGLTYSASAAQVEDNILSLQGTMMYYFIRLTKRPYPTEPTPDDIMYINAIWDTLGYPEKKLAT
jgi:hypothetical protein